MLNIYGGDGVRTPNIDRLAQKSIIFDNHWLGSAPCMPARRDLFTGRLSFLERPWGPIEPFDVTLPELLRKSNVFTHISTDHNHYFEIGGESYCQLFSSWDFHRGQEYDPWVSRVEMPTPPKEYYGKFAGQYELNRTKFAREKDFSTPKTFAAAAKWLKDNEGADDFFLMVEGFDPHEPFDCPPELLAEYGDDYTGPRFDWSTYRPVTEPPEAIEHLRLRYAATLTMADRWLGKLLDVLDEQSLWEDTLVILTTDHGHLLGEHGYTGKNYMHSYNELAHLPLIVHLPGGRQAGRRVDALTQNIDMFPTILDYHGITEHGTIHGHSLKDILEGHSAGVRDVALYGWFGSCVNITDGRYTYFRAPNPENQPLNMYCVIPTTLWRFIGRDNPKAIDSGRFLRYTDYPILRIPSNLKRSPEIKDTLLFDLENDYGQTKPLHDWEIEEYMIGKLVDAMEKHDSPHEQYARLELEEYL